MEGLCCRASFAVCSRMDQMAVSLTWTCSRAPYATVCVTSSMRHSPHAPPMANPYVMHPMMKEGWAEAH